MISALHALALFVRDLFKSRRRLEAENLILRHQLNVALRRAQPRLQNDDRLLLMLMTRLWPDLLGGPCRSAGDDPAMAPRWISHVLALEVAPQGRAAED